MSDVVEAAAVGQPDAAPATQGAPDSGMPTWTKQVKSDVVGDDLKGYSTLSDLVREHRSLKEKYTGLESKMAEGVAAPGEEATPEQVAAWRKALGVPESAEGYILEVNEELPAGMQITPEDLQVFREFALENNLSGEQAQKLLGWDTERKIAAAKAYQEQRQENHEQMVERIRQMPRGEERLEKVHRLLDRFGGIELREELNDSGWGDSPKLIDAFLRISESMSEGGLGTGLPPKPKEGELDLDALYPSMRGVRDRDSR